MKNLFVGIVHISAAALGVAEAELGERIPAAALMGILA